MCSTFRLWASSRVIQKTLWTKTCFSKNPSNTQGVSRFSGCQKPVDFSLFVFSFWCCFITKCKTFNFTCVCSIWWPSALWLVAKTKLKVSAKTCQQSRKTSGHYKPYVQTTLEHLRCIKVFRVSQALQNTFTKSKTSIFC